MRHALIQIQVNQPKLKSFRYINHTQWIMCFKKLYLDYLFISIMFSKILIIIFRMLNQNYGCKICLHNQQKYFVKFDQIFLKKNNAIFIHLTQLLRNQSYICQLFQFIFFPAFSTFSNMFLNYQFDEVIVWYIK